MQEDYREKTDEALIKDILRLRVEGMSYRQIERELDVSRETARVYCIERLPEEAKENLERRKELERKRKVRKANVKSKTRKKPRPQHSSVRDYDFLENIRVVYKHVLANAPDLNRGRLEMLLYLYPKGAFSFSEFHRYYKLVGLYQKGALKKYIKNGYIFVWREKTNHAIRLYALTNKAKSLCDDMHKFCTGEKDMPSTESTNKLFTDTGVRIDGYYSDMIKVINKRNKRNRDAIDNN